VKSYYSIDELEKTASYLVAGLMFLIVILLPLDSYEFLNNPDDYINVHHLDTTKELWQLHYLKNSLIGFPLCSTALIVILSSYKHEESRRWKVARRIIVITTFCLMGYGLYLSYLTGFDH